MLEERDDQGEESQRRKRSKPNQGESPERLRLQRCSCCRCQRHGCCGHAGFPSPVANGRRRTGASHLLSFRRAEWRLVRRCEVTLTPAAILAQQRPRRAAVNRAPPLRRHLLGHSIAQPTRSVCMWVDRRTRDGPRPEEYSRDRQNRYRRTGHTPECGCRRSRAHLLSKIVERACADAEHQTRGGAL